MSTVTSGGAIGTGAQAVVCTTRQNEDVDLVAVLADVARAGPFFTVDTGPAGAGRRPVGDLYEGDRALVERIAYVRAALRSDDRVAASITYQGLAALLVSAPFAAAVVHGVLPALTPSTLHWTPGSGSPWELWCPAPGGVAVPDPDDAADALLTAVVDAHLVPLARAVRARVSVSERVLHGNAASTVAAARRLVTAQWPGSAERAAHVAGRLLGSGVLAGTGERVAPQPPDRGWSFRRRSCCLYHRVPGGGLCGDCVLTVRSARP